MGKIGRDLTVIVLFFFLSIIMTYPLIFHLDTKVAGKEDVYQNIWNFWWFSKSISDGKNPYFTDMVFYPTGTSLVKHTLTPINSMIAMALGNFVPFNYSYNVIVLFSFFLSAFGMYLLSMYVTKSHFGSILAGSVFSFSSIHFAEVGVGHLNILSTQWMPLFVLFMMKAAKENKYYSIPSGLFLATQALSSWQLGFFCGMILILYCAHNYIGFSEISDRRRILISCISIITITIVLTSPILIPLLLSERPMSYGVILGTSSFYSADILTPFIPNSNHPLFGNFAYSIENRIKNPDSVGLTLSIGIISLFIAFFPSALQNQKKIHGWLGNKVKFYKKFKIAIIGSFFFLMVYALISSYLLGYNPIDQIILLISLLLMALILYLYKLRYIGFWHIGFFIFLVFSFGPILHVAGKLVSPLPYILVYYLPGFSSIRTPVRFLIPTTLFLAILVGKGYKIICKKIGNKFPIFLTLLVLILFENFSAPIVMSDMQVPNIYYNISKDDRNIAILEVPITPSYLTHGNISWQYAETNYMLYQTVHQKPIVGGYVTYPDKVAMDYIKNNKLFSILHSLNFSSYNYSSKEIGDFRNIIKKEKIGYVIIHRDYSKDIPLDVKIFENMEKLFKSIFMPNQLIYSDKDIIVYKVD